MCKLFGSAHRQVRYLFNYSKLAIALIFAINLFEVVRTSWTNMNFSLDCVGSITFINLELIIKAKVLFHVKQIIYGCHDAKKGKQK